MQAVLLISVVFAIGTSAQKEFTVKIPKSDYVWEPYPQEMLPHIAKAFHDISSSDAKMALLYHAWNILPQNGIFITPDEDTTTEETSTDQTDSHQEETTRSIGDILHSFHDDPSMQDRMGLLWDVKLGKVSSGERVPKSHRTVFIEGPHLEDQVAIHAVRGTPGEDFPDYVDIPDTSFSCADKGYIPGFYADLETGCQTFHVCWPHMKESFLCPIGTLFNQAILSCDFWYSSNCSLAPLLYDLNARVPDSVFYREESGTDPPSPEPVAFVDWTRTPKFHPVATKTEPYPESTVDNTVRRRRIPKEDGSLGEEETEGDIPVESTTLLPNSRERKVRINSKFIVRPMYVVGSEVWKRKVREAVEEGMASVPSRIARKIRLMGDVGGRDEKEDLCDAKATVSRQRLLSIVEDLVGESMERLNESVGTTVAV